jgi:DNA primase
MNQNSFKEEVRSANPIEQVIGRTVKLNSSHMGCCPFHEDKSPSLSVNPEKGLFHCFGCGASGDVFIFVMKRDGCSFIDALKTLARDTGLKMPNWTEEDQKQMDREHRIHEIRTAAVDFYHENLKKSGAAKKYLKNRKISQKLIDLNKIGFADGGLFEHLTSDRKYSAEECVEAGLIIRQNETEFRDFYHDCDRIILPNLRNGKVIHITGRAIGDEKPKYLHISGEIELWGTDTTRGKSEVTIVEGIFDALSLHDWEIPAVALIGVALKEEFVPFFNRFEKVYVCLDFDKTGRTKTIEVAKQIGKKAHIISLEGD